MKSLQLISFGLLVYCNVSFSSTINESNIANELRKLDNYSRVSTIINNVDLYPQMNKNQIGAVFFILGYSLDAMGKQKLAHEKLVLANQMINNSDYHVYKIGALIHLAHINLRDEKISIANSQLANALDLSSKRKTRSNYYIAWVLSAYSDLYKSVNNTSMALRCLNKAYSIHQSTKDTASLFIHAANLTELYLERDIDSATFFLNKSITYLKNSIEFDSVYWAATYGNIGQVAQYKKKNEEAIRNFKEETRLYGKFAPNNTNGNFHLGLIYYEMGNFSEAKSHFSHSINPENTSIRQKKIFTHLKIISEFEKNYAQVLLYESKIDSIINVIKNQKLKNQIHTITKELEYTNTKLSLGQKKALLTKNAIIFWLTTSLFIVLILTLFLTNKYKQIREAREINSLEQKVSFIKMNPHFIFNTLSSLQYIILKEKDPLEAATIISDFSNLVRLVFTLASSERITLREELKFLKSYIEMERFRFDNNFEFILNVDKNVSSSEIEVPPMLLQPFVENSINHGFSNGHGHNLITLNIYKVNKYLQFEIIDNGQGFDINTLKEYEEHALAIFKRRLKLRKKKEDTFFKISSNDFGTSIKFLLLIEDSKKINY